MPLHESLGISKTASYTVYSVGGQRPQDFLAEAGSKTKKSVQSSKGANAKAKESKKDDGKKAKGDTKAPAPVELTPELQKKFDTIFSVGEECISDHELKQLLLKKPSFNAYDGFEPSGRMHIAQGVFKAMNVNKITSSNGVFIFWVADWFALMNDKMGGDLDKIKVVGEYLKQVWAATGMDMSENKVIFKWASDEITNNASTYWPKMLDIARRFNITRIKKCCQIMGRLEGNLSAAQVLYPLMQCTDVFFLKADVCQLGVDQRKVNMLAREYCDAAKIKFKPVILSHHMLFGLKAGQEKMSKSDPDSAVFMEDSVEDVTRKIMAAYCPSKPEEKTVAKPAEASDDAGKESMHLVEDDLKNPCLDYIQNIVFGPPNSTFTCNGTTYDNFAAVRADFVSGKISEQKLKISLIDALNALLEPVRSHFTNDPVAKDLLAKVQQYKKEKAPLNRQFRRMDASKANVPVDAHVVFAPPPTINPTLQTAVDIIAQLNSGEASSPKVLFLSDWNARVLSSCDADEKVINAYYTLLTKSLSTISPSLMESVLVVKQSELILSDPSNYWISVINVGRAFNLNVLQEGYEDSDPVGNVISRMMTLADLSSLNAKSVSYLANDKNATVMSSVIAEYFKNIPLTAPSLMPLNTTSIFLQDGGISTTENSEYFLLDDPKVHGKLKMKKAFCEPGNVDFCPPISLASVFALSINKTKLEIARSPENGGNIAYEAEDAIKKDFKSGALHPGDLKAAVTAIVVELYTKLAAATKADKTFTQASKALKAAVKKAKKKK